MKFAPTPSRVLAGAMLISAATGVAHAGSTLYAADNLTGGSESGVAAVKEILRSHYAAHVFVTGDTIRGVPLGPEAVLIQKPFRGRDLELAIQRALAAAPVCD